MEEEELESMERCLVCSSVVTPGIDRTYEIGEEGVLCFECAVQRGGEYDADTERWAVAPDVSDVPIDRHVLP